jgi:vacuolar-type H+-ATPase subunit C/Vma6
MNDIYFASGVIACIESRLLSDSRISELREAKDISSFKALLSDTQYSGLDFDRALREFFDDVKRLAPELYDLFAHGYEAHDAKIAFRMLDGQLTKEEASGSMFYGGELDRISASEPVKMAIDNHDVALEVIDRYYMEQLYKEYKRIEIVRAILETEANYANTRAFLRLGHADKRVEIPFGKVVDGVKLTDIDERLEREIEEKLMDYRYFTIGYEPVFRYFYRRMNELIRVREIWLLKRAGL